MIDNNENGIKDGIEMAFKSFAESIGSKDWTTISQISEG